MFYKKLYGDNKIFVILEIYHMYNYCEWDFNLCKILYSNGKMLARPKRGFIRVATPFDLNFLKSEYVEQVKQDLMKVYKDEDNKLDPDYRKWLHENFSPFFQEDTYNKIFDDLRKDND